MQNLLPKLPLIQLSRQDLLSSFGFYFALIILSVFYGLLAFTANPILVGLGLGLLIGMALLFKPKWNIWLVLTLGLTVVGLLPLFVSFLGSKVAWGVSLLSFIVLGSALLRLIMTPSCAKDTPIFVWIAFAFMLYALINSAVQWNSTAELLTGFKRYFQAFSLIFALTWLAIDKKEIIRWHILILLVALLQLPFAIYQLIVYVPMREAMQGYIAGLVPIDIVSGTFGATLHGGGTSAEMATFLLIVFTFLVVRKNEKLLSNAKLTFLSLLILLPLFIGETKIIVVFLPLVFLVLYRTELLAKPQNAFIGFTLGGLLTSGVILSYIQITGENDLIEWLDAIVSYNFYEGHGIYELNRTTVLSFWLEQQLVHGPISFSFGNGLGSAHEATQGHIAARYSGYGIGLTSASTLLWDLGIFGLALFFGIFIYAWRCANQIRINATEAWIRADARAIQSCVAIFMLYLFYRSSLLEVFGFQIVLALVLGYLAWLHKLHVQNIK